LGHIFSNPQYLACVASLHHLPRPSSRHHYSTARWAPDPPEVDSCDSASIPMFRLKASKTAPRGQICVRYSTCATQSMGRWGMTRRRVIEIDLFDLGISSRIHSDPFHQPCGETGITLRSITHTPTGLGHLLESCRENCEAEAWARFWNIVEASDRWRRNDQVAPIPGYYTPITLRHLYVRPRHDAWHHISRRREMWDTARFVFGLASKQAGRGRATMC
jgi:hypothetical protein